MNHSWQRPETFAELGTIAAEEVEKISGGLLREQVLVKINKAIFDYDQVLICGPVFPHEVVGFSGGNKYLFPGISGQDMINQTHWIGALIGSYNLIGTMDTPVRAMINHAASMIRTPIACLALVVDKEGVAGAFFGEAREAWRDAARLSSQRHIRWLDKPVRRVLAVMPKLYDDMWTAAKGMYKAEPAISDGGEVIIFAPHITEISYTHGAQIDKVGYHCRDYFVKQWDKFREIPRGVLAHSTHLFGQGTYDAESGVEKARIHVTLATGIPAERCARVNLGYMNPEEIRPEEWAGREAEGILLIPRAGEILYRVKAQSA
jgi:nickel-dependent lactate racemase